ncbi:MAG: NAD(P)-binding protein [Actinobacteria bacterium]|nr:NAD(P)-binding protein [Actinomycetota bacterium]
MAENIVVGAGLSGLVAAVNLAREGREVLVLEKENRVGGSPLYHPSPEWTPVDLAAFSRYEGIDISSAVAPFKTGRVVVYGEMIPIDMDAISSYMIERGPRKSSLDTYLYELALAEGVKFEFGHPVTSSHDFAVLPPDTIISTGLYFEGFDALNVPYLTSFHFVARKTIDETEGNHVTIYHGGFTRDYSYTSSVNGIAFAHVFQRSPLGRGALEAFKEQVFISEGLEFESWEHFTFPVPAASAKNPRLFAGNKILAGTLAGCMESYMFFGMLGALVSGKIAAIAVSDKARALEEFELATARFRAAYVLRRTANMLPHAVQRHALQFALGRAFDSPSVAKTVRESMPGWLNCKRA